MFTEVENSVTKILRDAFVEVDAGQEAIAVVNRTARAVGLAVATAFTEAETTVSVTGEGVAEAQAESQASALAKATATAIVDAIAEATDGDRVALSNVSTEKASGCMLGPYCINRTSQENIGWHYPQCHLP